MIVKNFKQKNSIKQILISSGLSEGNKIINYFKSVRDRNDISVLKCKKNGLFFLSSTDHVDISKYEKKKKFKYFGNNSRKKALKIDYEDSKRRSSIIKKIVYEKKWLDIGTGAGGILDELKDTASECSAVEPNNIMRSKLKKIGYKVYKSSKIAKKNYYDVITLFHVFEHMKHPIKELKLIKSLLKKNSQLIIEVPHASDFLLKTLNLHEFKKFTFWSEHLILHVKKSLDVFLKLSNFEVNKIFGVQRYSLANHLYWIFKKKPGGHIHWNFMRFRILEKLYEKFLSLINQNDTLIIFARKK